MIKLQFVGIFDSHVNASKEKKKLLVNYAQQCTTTCSPTHPLSFLPVQVVGTHLRFEVATNLDSCGGASSTGRSCIGYLQTIYSLPGWFSVEITGANPTVDTVDVNRFPKFSKNVKRIDNLNKIKLFDMRFFWPAQIIHLLGIMVDYDQFIRKY